MFASSSDDKTKIRLFLVLLDCTHSVCEARQRGNIVASASLLISSRRHDDYDRAAERATADADHVGVTRD